MKFKQKNLNIQFLYFWDIISYWDGDYEFDMDLFSESISINANMNSLQVNQNIVPAKKEKIFSKKIKIHSVKRK